MLRDRALSPRHRPRPIADAARPAGPDLNPRIERLRVERIAMAMAVRESGSRPMSRLFHAGMRRPDFGDMDVRSGLRFRTRLRRVTVESVSASTGNGANCVGGPSGFGDNTAFDRSSLRNSSGRYWSAINGPLHVSSVAQTAAVKKCSGPSQGLLNTNSRNNILM